MASAWAAILRITRLPRRNHPRRHHANGIAHILSNSLSLPFIPCSFGFPALCSHASILPHCTSCEVAGVFTATVRRVAGPGTLLPASAVQNNVQQRAVHVQ